MAWFGRNERKFTEAESSQRFMEGVRWLQFYDAVADKPGALEVVLNKYLSDAERLFKECVDKYEDDIIPRYYYGLVLSIQGQVEQARQLRADLKKTPSKTPPPRQPDALFLKAAQVFERIALEVSSGDMLAYAQYNQAQVLAKTAPTKP